MSEELAQSANYNDLIAQMAKRISDLDRRVTNFEIAARVQCPIVAANPASGTEGDFIYNSTDGFLYVREGGAWNAV